MDRPVLRLRGPFLRCEIERARLERTIAARRALRTFDAGAVVVGDFVEPLLRAACRRAVDADQVALAKVIEQRCQPLLEQRQPVFHACQTPPVADRLIERVFGRLGAELFAVAGAKALDRILVEQRLSRRKQQVRIHRAGRALGARIEQPQRFELIAEEIEPQTRSKPRRNDVENRAAHREIACIDRGIAADVTLPAKQRDQPLMADFHAGLELPHQFADAERCGHPLGRGVDRGDEQLRTLGPILQAVECGQSTCADRKRRARTVVGKAVPGGKLDNVELGREIAGRFCNRDHRGLVVGNEHGAGRAIPRMRQGSGEIGHDERLRPARHGGQGQRRGRREDAVKIGHGGLFGPGLGQIRLQRGISTKSSSCNASIIGPA